MTSSRTLRESTRPVSEGGTVSWLEFALLESRELEASPDDSDVPRVLEVPDAAKDGTDLLVGSADSDSGLPPWLIF